MEHYHNNLKKLRVERNLLQKDVATLLGLHCQDRLSHWEVGRSYPSVPNLIRLCEIYGVPLNELYVPITKPSFNVILE
jgi:transcriptional regulator with XRE-family HTH domain